ncbi:exodeoxyribonuclease V subunit gamma [Aquabacterium sp. A08]|nr:exodeoxyribonuclease V subunit gamma [Aquabacterium sp. A08]NIC42680.1 exodeoxyribonuclease V subunit gamma [Aquabacterium sp. A08]
MVVHGNHAEALRDLAVGWLQRYPLAPLENETLLVQSNGIAQWLKLSLAETPERGGAGIAAALQFHLPSQFLWQAYRAVLGPERVPETSPFDKPRLVWRLMRLLPTLLDQTAYAPLQRFLADDADRRKRFQLAERLADLFDQYQVYRADWLQAWGDGQDVLIDARGGAVPLEADQRWQAALWRALQADVQTDANAPRPGRAAVHAAFLARARDWNGPERPAGLPRRLVVFGISSLPRQSLEVLAVLARWCQVLMCVHNPCEHHWADTVSDHELLRAAERHGTRQARRHSMPARLAPEQLHRHAHPLLAAWGKQGRDFIGLLNEHDRPEALAHYRQHFQAIGHSTELFIAPPPDTLLRQLQDDIRDLRPLHETRARWPAVDPAQDASVRFHRAHSPQREVEVLHDQLLAAFQADPTLTPRDVIVMVPDVQAYAPHIQAVFGLRPASDPRHIPYTVADQGASATDPLLHALRLLLRLPQARLSASELMDLLDVPAVARRFGIAPADRALLQRWVRGANVRWGLHAAHRASLDLPADAQAAAPHTWLFGLRRMLLGYAVGAGAEAWQGTDPYGEIGGLDAALLGPLVQLLERLASTWDALRQPAPVAEWCTRFRQVLHDFFDASPGRDEPADPRDPLTLLQLAQALDAWQAVCTEARLDEALPLAVAAEHWLTALDAPRLSQRFFGGAVTFATLMPMRAIPFRHVCLLGMNDGAYPRNRAPLDFDLMGRQYRPGDRSRRSDDHYMLLEALLSARDRLYVSWVGRSVTDNSERAPSVLVNQLREHLATGWRLADAAPGGLLAALTTEHPLQPFSPRYFGPATTEPRARWFTYAHEWRRGAATQAAASPPLPALARSEPLTVAELASFLKDPVKAFFRRRLGADLDLPDATQAEHEPFALDGLDRWRLHHELLQHQTQALRRGDDLADDLTRRLDALERRGELAAGGFGQAQRAELQAPLPELMQAYQTALADWPLPHRETLDWRATVDGQAVAVLDRLDDLRRNAQGDRARVVLETSHLVDAQGRYRADKLVGHWVVHLAAHLAGGPLTTRVLSKAGQVTLEPLPPEQAEAHWTALLQAWQTGLCSPLPLAVKPAFEWLRALGTQPDDPARAWLAAQKSYEGEGDGGERERQPHLRRAYPDFAALAGPRASAADPSPFRHWTDTLLRPLWRAIPVKRGKSAPPAPEAEA